MADEEDGRLELLAQPADQVEHLRLDGGVEPRGRLVEDEQARVLGERHRDHDPLLHPARELVGVAGEHRGGVGDLDAPKRLLGLLQRLTGAGTADPEGLGELAPHAQRGVEGVAGVLVDEGEVARA